MPTAPVTPASAPAGPVYDLAGDEARGGHTLARHVGRTDDDLRERLRRERVSAASTYTDRPTAERTVAAVIASNRVRIDRWLAREGNRPNLALDYRSAEPIGRSIRRGDDAPVTCRDAVVVLRWTGGRRFIVLTSYPEAPR